MLDLSSVEEIESKWIHLALKNSAKHDLGIGQAVAIGLIGGAYPYICFLSD